MRKLIWLIVILAGLYGGYWFVGAKLLDSQLSKAVAQQRAEGRQIDYAVLRVQGFPSRFDIHAEGLDLADPASGWGWKAPMFQLAALSYQPQHYIAVWPKSQQIITPGGPLDLASSDLRASLVFVPGPSFVLDRSSLVGSGLTLEQPGGFTTGAEVLRFSTARAAGTEFGHRLGLELQGLILPEAVLAQLAGAGLPERLDRLHLDLTADFDARWDRFALDGVRPQPTRLRLDDLTLTWGDLGIGVTGTLDLDAEGVPSGSLELTARNWRRMLDVVAPMVPQLARNRPMVEAALSMLAGTDPTSVRVTLGFQNGNVQLGPIPLGPAPRIRL